MHAELAALRAQRVYKVTEVLRIQRQVHAAKTALRAPRAYREMLEKQVLRVQGELEETEARMALKVTLGYPVLKVPLELPAILANRDLRGLLVFKDPPEPCL